MGRMAYAVGRASRGGWGLTGTAPHAMRRMRSKSEQAGATVLEYAILLAVLVGVGVAAAGVLGTNLDDMITTIASKIPGLTTGIGST